VSSAAISLPTLVFLVRFLVSGGLGNTQSGECLGLVGQANVRVPHGHPYVAVTSKLPGLWKCGSASQKLGDVGVPAGGVEIGDALGCLVRNLCTLQVFLHHEPGLFLFEPWEEELVRGHAFEPGAEQANKAWVERQRVSFAVFRAGSFDVKYRLFCRKLKASRREARKLFAAEARHVRQQVHPCSMLSAVALHDLIGVACGLDEGSKFFLAECSAFVPHVHFGVKPFKRDQRISICSA
jgi:hypothetical protein